MRYYQSSTIIINAIILGWKCVLCQCQNEQENRLEMGSENEIDLDADGDGMIAFLGILCAVTFSLVGVCVGYFAVLEDGLMRIFAEEGLDLRATVVETRFRRGAVDGVTPLHTFSTEAKETENTREHNHSRNEYNAMIEYLAPGIDRHEHCTVTKQVRVMESDFVEEPSIPRSIKIELGAFIPVLSGNSFMDESNSIGRPSGLDILVLKSHPKSAIPRRQAERACTLHYRLPTLLFVIFMIALSIVCLYVTLGAMDRFPLHQARATILVSSILLTTELAGVHILLGKLFRGILKDVYLDGGELEESSLIDETTISSKDDIYSQI